MKFIVKSVYTFFVHQIHVRFVLFLFLILFCIPVKATHDSLQWHKNNADIKCFTGTDSISLSLDTCIISTEVTDSRPNPLLQLFKQKQRKNKKITAAILAFPFPFGIVGLHRIYLGTSPHVPVVYIASLGGVFGILPFIDFCVLVLDKDIDRYIENKKVFMWVK